MKHTSKHVKMYLKCKQLLIVVVTAMQQFLYVLADKMVPLFADWQESVFPDSLQCCRLASPVTKKHSLSRASMDYF